MIQTNINAMITGLNNALFLFMQLYSTALGGPKTKSADRLAHTTWECKAGEKCFDHLQFKTGGKVQFTSCELKEEAAGSYRLAGDTLVVNTTKEGRMMKEQRRYKYVLQGEQLKPVRSEEFLHDKWEVLRSEFDPKYVFHKATEDLSAASMAMLRKFYTAYIRTANRYQTDEDRLRPLLKAHCDPRLIARLQDKKYSGDLDYDPFLKAQDVDLKWLRTLSVSKEPKRTDGYVVSFVTNDNRATVDIHLVVNKQHGVLKIRDVLLD